MVTATNEIRRWRALPSGERDAAALYDRLAAAETGERRAVLAQLAAVERRHAAHWENTLKGRSPWRSGARQLVIGGWPPPLASVTRSGSP